MSEEQVAEVAEAEAPSGGEDWRSMISEDLRGDTSLQHIGSIDAMAKSYINAQKMVGADKVAIPGSWGTDEDWGLVYNKLGRPDTPDAYELELGEDAGDFNDWYRQTAHEVGLNNRQAAALAEKYSEFAQANLVPQEMSEADQAVHEEQIKGQLREELGNNWEDRLGLANDLMKELDAPALSEITLSDGTLLGDNPDMIKFFVSVAETVAEATGEDGFAGRDSRPSVSDTELQDRISQLTIANGPYWVKEHPDHDRIVEEVLGLREVLHGE